MCCESLCAVAQPIEIFPTDVGRAAISSHGAMRLSCRCKSHVVEVGVSALLVHTGCNRLPAKLHNSPFPMVVDRQNGSTRDSVYGKIRSVARLRVYLNFIEDILVNFH